MDKAQRDVVISIATRVRLTVVPNELANAIYETLTNYSNCKSCDLVECIEATIRDESLAHFRVLLGKDEYDVHHNDILEAIELLIQRYSPLWDDFQSHYYSYEVMNQFVRYLLFKEYGDE